MKNLLALVGAVVVLVGGLGWYLGWYKIGTQPGSDGKTKIEVEVEGNKVKADLKKGKETVGEFIQEHSSKSVPGTPTSNSGPIPITGGTFVPPSIDLKDLPPPPPVPNVFPDNGVIPPLPPPQFVPKQ